MNKQTEFYSLKNILRRDAQYNIIYGERSNGKSYAVKEYFLKCYFEKNRRFIIIRRYDTDIRGGLAEQYFEDMPIETISNGKFNSIRVRSGIIYAVKFVDGELLEREKIGYFKALNMARKYTSTNYPDVDNVALEEFISADNVYLPNELFLFNHILSTIFRREDDNKRVFLIANALSRLSPYWREYGVDEIIKTQKQGSILIVERATLGGTQRVAVEYCKNIKQFSVMFSGSSAKMTNEGKWLERDFEKLPIDRSEWETIYTFYCCTEKMKYKCEYIINDENYCIYVTPQFDEIPNNSRVISDVPSVDPLSTVGFVPLNSRENAIFELIRQKRVFYSDNLTGTEFVQCCNILNKTRFLC